MELKTTNSSSSNNEKWKVLAIGGLFCFFVFSLFATSNFRRVDEITIVDTTSSISTPIGGTNITSNSSSSVEHGVDQTVDSSKTTAGGDIVTTNIKDIDQPPAGVRTMSMPTSLPSVDNSEDPASLTDEEVKEQKRPCNIFEGRWVYKPTESPSYYVEQCPFVDEQPSCRLNGRPDSDYEGWSWEPKDCHIPLFNGRDMLERLRGKRVIIVGDSLNRNQWYSLACLIYTSISPSASSVETKGNKILRVKDYDFSLEFYWSPLLVDVDYKRRVINLDKLDHSSEQWRGADVMVFNTGHWWIHGPKIRVWDAAKYKGKLMEGIKKEQAYKIALSTWSTWLTHNVDPRKTAVFFRSVSPEHKRNQYCLNATKPITDESYTSIYPKSMMDVAENMVLAPGKLVKESIDKAVGKFPVRYLNITWLSGYRMDAHPAVYTQNESKRKGMVQPQVDCSHWCLPGVPDTWNRLLYVSLFFSGDLLK